MMSHAIGQECVTLYLKNGHIWLLGRARNHRFNVI
jgi:hypothetical protein